MKRIHVFAVLLTLSVFALAFVSTASATAFGPYLETSRQGKIITWHFDTYDTTNGAFSGLTVDGKTIVAKWWDAQSTLHIVFPYEIVLTETYVELHFYKQNLPKSAVGNSVTGGLTTGDTFLASGPGWSFGTIH
jgi:hypothetical protein